MAYAEGVAPSFADELIAAPIGAVLLDVLERHQHPPVPWQRPVMPDAKRIAEAADHVLEMSWGDLLANAFDAASSVGPWQPNGADEAFDAYLKVEERRPIAEAVAQAFGSQLQAPIDLEAQEWWVSGSRNWRHFERTSFVDFHKTYGSGEFPRNAVRTVTAPPPDVYGDFAVEQELSKDVGRWSLPVKGDSLEQLPVFTVQRPSDWAELVERHPLEATPHQSCWGLPDSQSALPPRHQLFSLDNQHASIRTHDRHLVPDWTSVATEHSAVHLSWGGWILSEGYAHLDANNTVTMVRYWLSDRTFWLRDVFGDPVRLPTPDFAHEERPNQAQDERELLLHRLGR